MLLLFIFVPATAFVALLLPAVLTPVELLSDARSRALESVLLTHVDRLALLRAYLIRALVTTGLAWVLLAPPGLRMGHPPAPLLFAPDVWLSSCGSGGASGIAVSALGALSDAAGAFLAGCVGLACAVHLRQKGLAMGAALVVCAVVTLNAAVGGWLLRFLVEPSGNMDFFIRSYRETMLPLRQPGFTTLSAVFAVVYLPVCLLVGELFLRGAARGLDRLVTD